VREWRIIAYDSLMHYSFAPIVDWDSEVLILGTLPGPESLRAGQYYANPNNQFWRIIHLVFHEVYNEVYNEEANRPAYNEKVKFLLDRRIALWDVFHSAQRVGALDADIRNESPNDIAGLVHQYPGISRILLNGKTAEKAYRKHFSAVSVKAVYVPSTSPAYAKMPLADKINAWNAALTSSSLFDGAPARRP